MFNHVKTGFPDGDDYLGAKRHLSVRKSATSDHQSAVGGQRKALSGLRPFGETVQPRLRDGATTAIRSAVIATIALITPTLAPAVGRTRNEGVPSGIIGPGTQSRGQFPRAAEGDHTATRRNPHPASSTRSRIFLLAAGLSGLCPVVTQPRRTDSTEKTHW